MVEYCFMRGWTSTYGAVGTLRRLLNGGSVNGVSRRMIVYLRAKLSRGGRRGVAGEGIAVIPATCSTIAGAETEVEGNSPCADWRARVVKRAYKH